MVKKIVYNSDDPGARGKKRRDGRIDLYLWDLPDLSDGEKENAANTSFAARTIWLPEKTDRKNRSSRSPLQSKGFSLSPSIP